MRGLRTLLVVSAIGLALAGCSGPPSSSADASTGASGRNASPTAASPTSASPKPAMVAFTSRQYGYSVAVPSTWSVAPATEPWDGQDVDHTAAYADRLTDEAGNEYFVIGTPTTSTSAGVADQHTAWLTAQRGCPSPATRTTITLDGVPAERLAIHCPDGVFGPTLVSKVIAVHDGQALILTSFSPDTGSDEHPPLDDLILSLRWTPAQ